MSQSMSYICNRDSLRHNGRRYGPGEPVPVEGEQAAALLALEAVVPAADPTDDDAFAEPATPQAAKAPRGKKKAG